MSYTDKKATISFYDIQTETTEWTLDIYDRDAYAGEVIELDLSDTPILLRYGGDGDLFCGKRGSELTINILCELDDDFDWIKTSDSTKFLVDLHKNGNSYWLGYILPGSVVEDFESFREISIIATDRLGLMDDTSYLDSGYAPEGYQSMMTTLRRLFTILGLGLDIRSGVNLYDDSMSVGDNDDPLNQAFIQQNKFIDDDLNPASCATVLDSILEVFDARAFQCDGYWHIIRSIEYASATIECRDYQLDSGALQQHVHLSVQKTVTDPGNATIFHLMEGTQTESQLGFKNITVIENKGLRPSLLPAYNFPENEFVAGVPRHYTISATSGWKKVNNNDACLMYCPADSYVGGQYFESNPIPVYLNGAVSMKLTIKGGCLTYVATQQMIIYFMVNTGATIWYWKPSGWTETEGTGWKPFFEVAEFDSPKDHEFTIDAWPADGDFSIRFYDRGFDPFISEIILLGAPEEDEYFSSGSETTAVIDANNLTIPEEKSMIFSSAGGTTMWRLSFYDGLIRTLSATGIPATIWRPRGSSGSYYDLKDWKIQSRIDQNKTPLLKIRAVIVGEYDYYQSIVIPALGNKVFAPDDVEIDFRNCLVTGTFIEVKTPATAVSYSTASNGPSAPGAIGKGITRSGYIVDVLPIQTGGSKIVVSGSSVLKTGTVSAGSGGSSITDYVRAKKGVVLTAGANAITFTDTLPTGYTYVLYAKAYTSEGYDMGYTISSETVTGFTITVDEAGTLDYQIMVEI
jgi:hypothetical protein